MGTLCTHERIQTVKQLWMDESTANLRRGIDELADFLQRRGVDVSGGLASPSTDARGSSRRSSRDTMYHHPPSGINAQHYAHKAELTHALLSRSSDVDSVAASERGRRSSLLSTSAVDANSDLSHHEAPRRAPSPAAANIHSASLRRTAPPAPLSVRLLASPASTSNVHQQTPPAAAASELPRAVSPYRRSSGAREGEGERHAPRPIGHHSPMSAQRSTQPAASTRASASPSSPDHHPPRVHPQPSPQQQVHRPTAPSPAAGVASEFSPSRGAGGPATNPFFGGYDSAVLDCIETVKLRGSTVEALLHTALSADEAAARRAAIRADLATAIADFDDRIAKAAAVRRVRVRRELR